MWIAIDIDDNLYTRLFNNGIEDYAIVNDDLFTIAKLIRKATPIPKGHGDLVGINDVAIALIYSSICDSAKCGEVKKVLSKIPIIVKGSKE